MYLITRPVQCRQAGRHKLTNPERMQQEVLPGNNTPIPEVPTPSAHTPLSVLIGTDDDCFPFIKNNSR